MPTPRPEVSVATSRVVTWSVNMASIRSSRVAAGRPVPRAATASLSQSMPRP